MHYGDVAGTHSDQRRTLKLCEPDFPILRTVLPGLKRGDIHEWCALIGPQCISTPFEAGRRNGDL